MNIISERSLEGQTVTYINLMLSRGLATIGEGDNSSTRSNQLGATVNVQQAMEG